MTHTQRFIHRFDTVAQTLLLVAAVFSGLLVPFFYMLLLFFIGVWQLTSALFRMIAFRDFTIFTYFMSAIVYCLLLASSGPLLSALVEWDMVFLIWFVGIVPTIGAVWYLQYCLQLEEQPPEATPSEFVPERQNEFDFARQSLKIRDKRLIPLGS
jgi:hypothetical protein